MNRLMCGAAATLVVAAGCSPISLAKRGLEEVRGASGELVVLQELSASAMADASRITVGPMVNDAGPDCPEPFRLELQDALRQAVARASTKMAKGSGPALRLEGKIVYFRHAGARKLLGGMAMALARIRVVDAASGQIVGRANAVASSKAVRAGREQLARAIAKEVAAWLARRARPAE
ncbi:MAG: hypothetical protein ACE5K7_08030 [Phycisphaerae bacterium]